MKKTLKKLIQQAAHFGLAINRGEPPELRLAHEKRAYGRELRAAGCSRKEANRMVWERYRGRG